MKRSFHVGICPAGVAEFFGIRDHGPQRPNPYDPLEEMEKMGGLCGARSRSSRSELQAASQSCAGAQRSANPNDWGATGFISHLIACLFPG